MNSPEYYKGKEQTYLKHFFLERYLETVAFHIGYTYREFVYVDCFSGPWKAADEQLADTSIRCNRPRLLPSCRAVFLSLGLLGAEGCAVVKEASV